MIDKNVDNTNLKDEKSNVCLSIIYRDAGEQICQVSVPFGEQYYDRVPYKENFEDFAATVMDDGIFWVGNKMLVPSHRILAFVPTPPKSNSQSTKPNSNVTNKTSKNNNSKANRNIREK